MAEQCIFLDRSQILIRDLYAACTAGICLYSIHQANPSGTRSIEVSNENLRTIEKYALFRHLIDSTGIVDEAVLDKLKLNIRSLIASQEEDSKDLLDLCIDVIYHNNMKAFGLQQLIKLYLTWLSNTEAEEEEE